MAAQIKHTVKTELLHKMQQLPFQCARGGSNPSAHTIDKKQDLYTVKNSIPAKPLPSMLNCGGFFYAHEVSV